MRDQFDQTIKILVENIGATTPSEELLRKTQALLNVVNAKETWERTNIGQLKK